MNRRVPNGTHGGVRGRENLFNFPSYSIVLYYSFARKNNSHKISPNDVQSIDAEALSDGDIAEYCNHIYEIYHSLGGTGKIAKGSQIIEMLIREFE